MSLATTQREIARLVRAPEGVAAALAEAAEGARAALAAQVRDEAPLGAVARLEVYANAYFFRIRDVLAEAYESLVAAIGADGFNDLLTAYLWHHPSRAASLRRVGDGLAAFLEAHPAAAPFRERWPFAADLARLECALADAFDAADVPPLSRDDLASLAPDDFAALVFALHPSVRLLRFDRPVLRFHHARLAGETEVALPATAEPGHALVWRLEEQPRSRTLDPVEADLLAALAGGDCFAALCDRAVQHAGEDGAAARVAEHLGVWLASGLIVRPG